jgi:ABC-type antimicrobial peptide transport system permease subunit
MFVMLVIVLLVTKMGLYERQVEIGTLISLGMPPGRITSLFISEVVIKVLIGYLAGFVLAFLILLGIIYSGGIHAQSLVEQFMNGGKILVPVIDPINISIGFCAVITAAVMTTYFSCRSAASQDAVVLLSSKK